MSASAGPAPAPASTPVRKRKKDTLTLDTKTDTDLLRTPVSKHSTKPSGTKSPWWNAFLESPLVNVDPHGGVSPQMRGRFSPSPKASPALKLSSPNSMRNMSRTSLLNSSPTSKLWEAALGTPSSPSRHPRGPIIGSLASAAAESSSNLAALASSSSSDHLSVPADPSLAITGTAIYPNGGPRHTPERKRTSGTYTFLRHVAPSSESRDLDPVLSDVDLPSDPADRDRLLQLGSAVAQQTAADAPIGVHMPPMRDKSVRKPNGVRDESDGVDDAAAKNLMALEKPVRNSSTLVFGSSILGTKRGNGAVTQPQVAPSDSESDSETSEDEEEEEEDASEDETPAPSDKKLTTPPKRTSDENKDSSGERSAKRRRGTKAAEKRCNCKKSKCLKLYCECFARQGYCKDCNCQGCNNTEEYEDIRQKAIQVTLERDPNAFFRSSATGAPSSAGPGAGAAAADDSGVSHPKGCHCKKSQCLKKYCECYQANAPCGDLCKCVDCKNGGPNTGSTPNKRRAGVIKPGTKKSSPQPAHNH